MQQSQARSSKNQSHMGVSKSKQTVSNTGGGQTQTINRRTGEDKTGGISDGGPQVPIGQSIGGKSGTDI